MEKIKYLYLFFLLALTGWPVSVFAMSSHVQGPNRAPVASAGFDQVVEVYSQVKLDGSESFDPDGDKLFYIWRILYAPEGATARLGVKKSMEICFRPDKEGVWLFGLTVTDGRLKSKMDVTRVSVKLPEKLHLPEPSPAQPDFKILKVIPLGLKGNTVSGFHIEIVNLGADYSGDLEFRIIGMDQLINGHFSLDKRVTVRDLNLKRGEKRWLTLLPNQVEWPERIRWISFGVKVDPSNRVHEVIEKNNLLEITKNRINLSSCCGICLPDSIRINGRAIKKGQRYSFPYKKYGNSIGIDFINTGEKTETITLSFVYDWSPVKSGGENILIKKYSITLAPNKERFIRFEGLRIPRKKKYKTNYTTFAVLRSHKNGYDVLYETPVTADYVEIVGK